MIELEIKNRKYVKEYDIEIDEYLTDAKIELIAEEMMKFEKQTEREYVKNILLCKTATNIDEDFDYAERYMDLMSNGIFDMLNCNIKNVDKIDKYISYAESANVQLNKFLGALNEPFCEMLKSANVFVQKLDADKLVKLLAKGK